jgi:DNA-binding beta-propeller fold protein YncE
MSSSYLRNIAIASVFTLITGLCTGTAASSARADAACLAATVASYTVMVPGRPFAVRELPDAVTAFVSVNPETPLQIPGIAVLKCTSGRFVYTHTIPLSPQPTGLALTPDGKLLIVADDSYIAFLRTDRLSENSTNAITYVKAERGDIEDDDAGAIYVSVTPDGRYAFVSEEQAGTLTVVDLVRAEAMGPKNAIVGDIDVGDAPITTLFSSDGKTLYGTIERASPRLGYPRRCRTEGADPSDTMRFPPGAVFSLDVATAERASGATLRFAASQCSTVRMALVPGEGRAWVTNRASGSISLFDLEKLEESPKSSRVTDIAVGSNPVPVVVTRDGRYVLAGITNRFGPGGATAGRIVVIDNHTARVVGSIPVGKFPRDFSYGREPTLFLSNNRSDSVTVFNENLIPSLITSPSPFHKPPKKQI